MLTVKEAAELKGCSAQYIQKLALCGKIEAITQINPQNNKPQYMIPISSLPSELQIKYFRGKKSESGAQPALAEKPEKECKKAVKRSFEELSADERQQVAYWTKLLDEWQRYRVRFNKKTECDSLFVAKCKLENPDCELSTDTLYRKLKAYRENDWDGLVDKRGGWNRGNSSIPPRVWEGFLWFYMDENKPTVSRCYELAKCWTQEYYPELYSDIPSERSFRRHLQNDINEAVRTYMRDGDKACNFLRA